MLPTINELEAILASEDHQEVRLGANGEVFVGPSREELAKDAARYQFVKQNFKNVFAKGSLDYWVLDGEVPFNDNYLGTLDEAIDRAMTKQQADAKS